MKRANMKNKLNALLIVSALVLGACGEQDPTKDAKYEKLKNTTPTKKRGVEQVQSVMAALYQIDADSDRNFYQNVEKSINFKVRLNFANPESVRYNLVLKSEELKKLGARFVKSNAAADTWTLTWQPSAQILTSLDSGNKPFDFEVQFVLAQDNAPMTLNQFRGQEDTQEFRLYVLKDQSQPILKDEIKIAPSATLNPDQAAKIQFTVAAKGFDRKESIDAILTPGPDAPTSELTQVDALVGKRSNAKLIRSNEVDKEGNTLFVYELNIDTRLFADYVMSKINESDILRSKFNSGKINVAEAVFYVEGMNRYNGQRSAQKMIRFDVNLTDKPGRVIMGAQPTINAKIGADTTEHFTMRTADGRSSIKIEGISVMGEALSLAKPVFQKDDVTVSLICSAGSNQLAANYGCKTGVCYQDCYIHTKTKCSTKAQKLPVIISTVSTLRGMEEKSTSTITVNVADKSDICQTSEAKAIEAVPTANTNEPTATAPAPAAPKTKKPTKNAKAQSDNKSEQTAPLRTTAGGR